MIQSFILIIKSSINKIKTLHENAKYFGYPKLDNLADHKPVPHERPVIILAPHQDLHGIGTAGTFLNTWPLYLEVPKRFPDVDFIFRPHPLWLPNLQLEMGGGKSKGLSGSGIEYA